ncbi:ABC transporter ATP-binding protein [Streptomyces sp. NPDC050560]|uniref:ABC transporter ATP-binding protein n=1 Tax=Streptomyces sp. NPDC050560 TaxID=3365630 RepID=UPI00379C477F
MADTGRTALARGAADTDGERDGAEGADGGPMVRAEGLHRSYGTGAAAVHALRGVSFTVPRGELVALKGRSGSGKTTLLNLVGGLDRPDAGTVVVDGLDLAGLGEKGALDLRRDRIGFVFQSFGLIPILTAAENVGVPMRLRGADPREREERVELLLSLVGLADHARQRPGELSGGQQQRVAIARALANRPSLIIADEPTGQLDAETGHAVMELLRAVVRGEGVTALVATHDAALLDLADRVLELSDGTIVHRRGPGDPGEPGGHGGRTDRAAAPASAPASAEAATPAETAPGPGRPGRA